MADVKINDLAAAGSVGDTMQLETDIGGATSNKVTAPQLSTYVDQRTGTLTNKTFDANGTGNSLSNVETADIASGSRSGADATLITGTAGIAGDLALWNGDGDLIDGPTPPVSDIVGTTDTQTISNKTLTSPVISQIVTTSNGDIDLAPNGTGAVTLTGAALDLVKGADIASATTTDIGAASGNYVDITGTTTITGLGTVQAGTQRWVQFDGILTLTHNGTSLILPTSANITTAAGDTALFISLGSGNWICAAYLRADGSALAGGGGGSGDVVGPASATDTAIALFDTTTGKLLKDSGNPARVHTGGSSIYIGGGGTSGSGDDNNTVMGINAGNAVTSGDSNTIIGANAGDVLTTGSFSTFIGNNAGGALTTSDNNTLIGHACGDALTTSCTNNAFVGTNCGGTITSTNVSNTAMGHTAFNGSGTSCSFNAAFGAFTLSGAGTKVRNTAIGASAGQSVTTGNENVFLGQSAGSNVTSGSNNVLIGYDIDAPSATASGQLGIAGVIEGFTQDGTQPEVSINALFSTQASSPAQITADQNDYDVGNQAFIRLSTDASRTITGIDDGTDGRHLYIINVGSNDLILADENAGSSAANRIALAAGADLTLGAEEGVYLIYDSTSSRWREVAQAAGGGGGSGDVTGPASSTDNAIVVFDGTGGKTIKDSAAAAVLRADADEVYIGGGGASASGASNNAAIGLSSLNAVTSGSRNSAVGASALAALTNGNDNTSIGNSSGDSLSTSSNQNVCVGSSAGAGPTTSSSNNVFIGYQSANSKSSASVEANVAIGYQTMNAAGSSNDNTAVGGQALFANTTGSDNTSIGRLSLSALNTGSNNIAIGYQAADNVTSGSNNLVIGYNLDPASATGSHQLEIGGVISGTVSTGTRPAVTIDTAAFQVYRTATAVSVNSTGQTIIGVTDTSASRTVTLDTDDVVAGNIIIVKDESGAAGTNNITVATEGAETIDGSSTITISSNHGVARVYSDGTNWFTF